MQKMPAIAVASAAAMSLVNSGALHAAGTEALKMGVIGCGGRGSGAVGNCIDAATSINAPIKVWAIGDVFPDAAAKLAKKHEVPAERTFSGLDAYQKVIASGVDFVILATPPGFRPYHFKAAVEAGKHVFMEKPVAVDPTGVRIVLEAAEIAKQKNLSVVAGTQRRHDPGYNETIKRIHDGEIGQIVHMQVTWNGGGIWFRPRKEGMSDTEYQIHNWYHFLWTCGDQICEQHVHNLDVANWVMNDHPISAYGSGGRQVRKEPGEIWDHFYIEYEYPNGGRVISACRHWPGCDGGVSEYAIGTLGTATPSGKITRASNVAMIGAQGPKGKAGAKGGGKKGPGSPYVLEHVDLLKSIRNEGPHFNEAKQVAESTMVAIMGRMSCYTGKVVTWDFAMKSQLNTMPANLDLKGKLPEPHVPMPGTEKLI